MFVHMRAIQENVFKNSEGMKRIFACHNVALYSKFLFQHRNQMTHFHLTRKKGNVTFPDISKKNNMKELEQRLNTQNLAKMEDSTEVS